MSESKFFQNHQGAAIMKVFLHDIEELVNPNIATDDLWMGTVTYPVVWTDYVENGRIINYNIAMNTTSLFVISGYKEIAVWDFLKMENDFDQCQGKTEGRKSILKRIKSWTRRNK